MPSLSELTDLFGELPILPPPAPRKRMSFAQQKAAAAASSSPPAARTPEAFLPPPPLIRRIFAWIWPLPGLEERKAPARPTNPFPFLKTGNKIVVIAVVDAGTISFFRFGQGVFAEFPMA